MSSSYNGSSAGNAPRDVVTITIPADGDGLSAESVNVALRKLADIVKLLQEKAVFPSGVANNSATSGQPGVKATGLGSGAGVHGVGTSTSAGVYGQGAADGYGLQASSVGAGAAVFAESSGAGPAGKFTGIGASARGIEANGGANASGVVAAGGATAGNGVEGTSAAVVSACGVVGTTAGGGNAITSYGVKGVAGGAHAAGWTRAGVLGDGSASSSYGVVARGDPTSPVFAAFRIEPQDAAPSAAEEGALYVNSVDHKLYLYNGTAWVVVGSQT